MCFENQIREIRQREGVTQEEFAEKLCVTRQAVSNWENGKNLPDIEMLMRISKTYKVSLDDLVLGGNKEMNNMANKLIQDGSEMKRTRYNIIGLSIGLFFFLAGCILLVIKGLSVEYVDAAGILHENFYLIPAAFLSFLFALLSFGVIGVRKNVILVKKRAAESPSKNHKKTIFKR